MWYNGLLAVLSGLCVGSFLNVCIFRLPLGKSLSKPRRSFCPRCNHAIPWYYNIPVLSFATLRGKCRFCRGRISFIYPAVEILTAALFFFLYKKLGLGYAWFVDAVLCSGLIVSTFIDIKHRIIPDEVSIGGVIAGLILSSVPVCFNRAASGFHPLFDSFLLFSCVFVIVSFLDFKQRIPDMVMILGLVFGVALACLRLYFLGDTAHPVVMSSLGILIGAGIVYLTGTVGDFIFKKESMGGGDVKLLAMIGAFLGYKQALLTFFMAPFFGLGIGVYVLIKKKDHTIPYGPFLSLAAFVSIFWYNDIIRFIFPSF